MPPGSGHSADSDRRELRTTLRAARTATAGQARERATRALCARVRRLRTFANAKRIGAYLAAGGEVEVAALIEHALACGKEVYVPIMRADHHLDFVRFTHTTTLAPNRVGLLEPVQSDAKRTVSPMHLDLVLTPLVGFDAQARRLGMGGGYYDRTFAALLDRRHWRRPRLLGVAFECQRVAHPLATAPWDVPLWKVVTQSACYPRTTTR